jgi:hypothetical protein
MEFIGGASTQTLSTSSAASLFGVTQCRYSDVRINHESGRCGCIMCSAYADYAILQGFYVPLRLFLSSVTRVYWK